MKRDFKTVVKTIKHAEKDVDKVLKAARLERHEKKCCFDAEILFAAFCLLLAFGFYALIILTV